MATKAAVIAYLDKEIVDLTERIEQLYTARRALMAEGRVGRQPDGGQLSVKRAERGGAGRKRVLYLLKQAGSAGLTLAEMQTIGKRQHRPITGAMLGAARRFDRLDTDNQGRFWLQGQQPEGAVSH